MLEAAWHTAVFYRVKDLPSLPRLLGEEQDGEVMSDVALVAGAKARFEVKYNKKPD